MRRSISVFYLVFIYLITSLPAKLSAQNADEIAIKKLLGNQTHAWSKGDIDEFMKGYWQSDSLVFTGKKGLNYGYKTTLDNYKKSYPDTASMGKLDFQLLQLKKLSFEYYFVIGKFHLKRSIGDLEGYFTLLFKKIKNKWFIISDHTS